MTMDRTLLFLLVFLTVVCLSQRRPGNVFVRLQKGTYICMITDGQTTPSEHYYNGIRSRGV